MEAGYHPIAVLKFARNGGRKYVAKQPLRFFLFDLKLLLHPIQLR
jgi:hypothetical protein